ncbi:hypothetical protein SMSP2_00369 [Limihaloglobus sulfuriphilus]|uniref:DUF4435 domain-containing protein n=1 Tax=Limihaloglobus sulfuriphilus TaxID=1851148 RepID=A0A1Q2MCQ8_9BACT|nr:DUF4435 domain-containing protein [Limihaloglobus sulfuriphilus]AQQ70032.1 hypothetical protein SMSP2_00369 [Limihaloglobus sulfuriphilus]
MRRYLDENDIMNEIRLELRHPSTRDNVWVLVEGPTDQRLFSKLLDADKVRVEIVHGGGVEPLLRAIEKLARETDRIVAIRDSDFIRLEGKFPDQQDLYITDAHDAEMMMAASNPTFRSLVSEYLTNRLDDYLDLRDEILRSIAFAGAARWLNHINSLTINFSKLGLGSCYRGKQLRLHKKKYLRKLHAASPNRVRDLNLEEVEKAMRKFKDLFNLCHGHDFEKVVSLHISQVTSKDIRDDDVGKTLRLAYSFIEFAKTELYKSLRGWEREHGYKLFSKAHSA